MRASSKPGLADLKRLRQSAQASNTPADTRVSDAAAGAGLHRRGTAAGKKAGARPESAQTGPAKTPDETGAASAPCTARQHVLDGRRALMPEDRALFRQAVKSVQPLAPSNRAIVPPAPMAPAHLLRQKRQAAAGTEAPPPASVSDHYTSPRLAADGSRFAQAGHGPDLLKGLARGKWPIGATLDLHGATLDEARLRLDGFLRSCLLHGLRCVRIVHGKGHGSRNNAPILKETVRRWLTQLEAVMAYTECAERDGGAGAVQVLLRAEAPKKSRPAKDRRP